MGTGTTRAPSSVAIFWEPSVLPLSATMTSPAMLLSRKAATAWRTQKASVSASLRQNIKMMTNSSLIYLNATKVMQRGFTVCACSGMSVFGCCWYGLGGKVEWKSVEVGLAELMPAGGDGVGAGHEAWVEVADEDLGAFATRHVVSLFAVGNGGEIGVERRLGLVDLGEDADAGEARPVDVVGAGNGADTGDGVAGADAEVVEGVCGGEDVMVVPSGGGAGEDKMAAQFADDACGFSYGEQSEEDDGG